jgi:hypothetical protein
MAVTPASRFCALTLSLCCLHLLPIAGAAAAERQFPGEFVSDVVVPVPSEIFSVLDKLGEPNWQQEVRKPKLAKSGDRVRLALQFGSTVAEGFVAVQAQDKDAVKDIGRDVIDLATSLGLIQSVRPHAQAILDAADKSDWSAIRREFDRTQKTVRATMDQMRDGDLSQCVSMGGWLRGTSSVTSIINKNFSEDRAELLNQPMLVEHFIKAIGSMSAAARSHDLVKGIESGLQTILGQMNKSKGRFSKESVLTIGGTCQQSLAAVLAK